MFGALERTPFSATCCEFKHKFPVIYAIDWMLWPGAQAINFAMVPAAYRVTYVNVVVLIWDTIMSAIKHSVRGQCDVIWRATSRSLRHNHYSCSRRIIQEHIPMLDKLINGDKKLEVDGVESTTDEIQEDASKPPPLTFGD